MSSIRVKAVIFDIGNVLVPWNPRLLYRKLIPDEREMERFLAEICTSEWNETLDTGIDFSAAIEDLARRFPGQAALIRAYDERWGEMLGAPVEENVALIKELKAKGRPLYALSNWSAVKFRASRPGLAFLDLFDDIVVSGEVGLMKPSPEMFNLLLARHHLKPEETVFIDDTVRHVEGARRIGMNAVHYESSRRLREELELLGVL